MAVLLVCPPELRLRTRLRTLGNG